MQHFSPLGAFDAQPVTGKGQSEYMNFDRINSPYSEPSCAVVMPMPVHFLRGCKSVPSWCASSIFHGLADLVLPVFVMRQMAQLYGEGGPFAGPNGGNPVPATTPLPEYDTNVLFVLDGSIDVNSGHMRGPLVSSLSRYPFIQQNVFDDWVKAVGSRSCLPLADFGDEFSSSKRMEYYYSNELRPGDVRLRMVRQYSDLVVTGCTTGQFAGAGSKDAAEPATPSKVAMRAAARPKQKVVVGIIHRTAKAGENGRVITNFGEMVGALKKYFNVIEFQFSKATFAEDVRRMQTVDILVGQHGAGLTNLIFLPRTAAVLELQPAYATLFGVQMGLFP
jgi:hypothetical protein